MPADYINIPLSCLLKDSEVFYNSVSSVPKDVETDVLSVNIPADQTFIVLGGSATGKVDADFNFYINGSIKETKRLAWTNRNVDFRFTKKVEPTQNMKITVKHSHIDPHDFQASIFGIYVE